jgi:hypothetical protein
MSISQTKTAGQRSRPTRSTIRPRPPTRPESARGQRQLTPLSEVLKTIFVELGAEAMNRGDAAAVDAIARITVERG